MALRPAIRQDRLTSITRVSRRPLRGIAARIVLLPNSVNVLFRRPPPWQHRSNPTRRKTLMLLIVAKVVPAISAASNIHVLEQCYNTVVNTLPVATVRALFGKRPPLGAPRNTVEK